MSDPEDEVEPSSPGTDDPAERSGGIVKSTQRRVEKARAVAMDRYDAAEERVPQLSLGREFIARYRRLGGTVLAGHIAFRSFLWFMPFLLVLVGLAGLATARGMDVQYQAGETLQLGKALGSTFKDAGSDAQGSWWQVTSAAVSGLVLGTLGLLSAMHYAFSRVWDLPVARIDHKATAALKFAGSMAMMVILLLVSSAIRRIGPLGTLGGLVMAMALLFVAFLGLCLFMPHRGREWYWAVPGAVVGSLGFLGLQIFATVYIPTKVASASRTYGSLGVAFTFLAYLFLLGHVIVASGLASAVWYDHYHREDDADHGSAAATEPGPADLPAT
jgi:membrane protein